MKNRDIVIRLRPYTSNLTWNELNSLTKQGVIDAFTANSDPLSAYEIEQLDDWGWKAFNYLKQEWIYAQHEDFITNRYIPAFQAINGDVTSQYTVQQVYNYTISEGLSKTTADAILEKAARRWIDG